MTTRFPLQPLLDLSRTQLDEATRKLGQLIASHQEASQRHQLLVTYREEYHTRFVAAAKNGLNPSEWHNYSQFLMRIDEAIAQAEHAVQATQQHKLDGQKSWIGKQGRVKAFDTLSDRHSATLAKKEQRSEQKAGDEHAARGHREKTSPP
jgi:flagellar FliJ protein